MAGDPTAPQSTVPSLGKQPSDAYVSFDGRKVEAEKYNINGNNYFKLREGDRALLWLRPANRSLWYR